ncbi:hypothetical protein AB0F25_30355 [Streptomyces wedmorensis]|uniref:hypothetical protein n=1 Tax=Streptomyces wedmorensis TaxID=43759 RepID=UPI00342F8B67
MSIDDRLAGIRSESLDRHITGNHGEDSVSADPIEVPILMAWAVINKTHAPLPAETMDALEKALAEHPFDSEVGTELLREYYGASPDGTDEVRDEARELFTQGWIHGVDRQEFAEAIDANQDGWEVTTFSYLLGFIAGHFAYILSWASPYEKDAD